MIEASASIARRFLVLRHLLAPPRGLPADPASVLAVVDRLGSLQFDPLEVAGRNHDLVLLARVAGYRRAWTDALLYDLRVLFEAYNKGLSILPTSELPYHRITWDRARAEHTGGAFDEHAPLVEELLDRIRRDGALSSTDLEPRAAIDWYWRPTNQVRALLEALAEAGIIAITRREGNRRVYDLAERLFPPEILSDRPPEREQRRHRLLSRYRAHGLLGTGGQAELWFGVNPDGAGGRAVLRDDLVESGDLVPVRVEGIRGDRFVIGADTHLLETAAEEIAGSVPPGRRPPGVALLAPLDPLVWDRDLLRTLFGFDYVWEVYVPERRRRWGYYVLPILFGDRLVGRIEPRIDRRAGALRVLDLWWEEGFEPLAEAGFVDGLGEALRAHRDFAGLQRVVLPRTARHRALAGELRPLLR
ncbi:MAG: winged helix-turn-helix domain-containing protein [Candidatus Limnocylindrales bacterium]